MSNPQLNQEVVRIDGEQRAKKAAIGKGKMKQGRRSLVLGLIFAIVGFIFLTSSGAGAQTLGVGLLAAGLPLLLIGLIYLMYGFFTWRANR